MKDHTPAIASALSRAQRNELLVLVRDAALDPTEFEWSPSENATDRLVHQPTLAWLRIEQYKDQWGNPVFRYDMWPGFGVTIGEGDCMWPYVRDVVETSWLRPLAEHHQTADLWMQSRVELTIPNTTTADIDEDGQDFSPFSQEELILVEVGLREIREFIVTEQQLDGPDAQRLARRFEYLLDAAKRGVGRIDWLNIFAGQIFSMAATGLIDSRIVGSVSGHAARLLGALYNFGIKLIGG